MEKARKWIYLPEKYQLVVGDTFELFYRGVILANAPYTYNIKVSCPKGAAYRRKFVFTPTPEDVGTYTLELSLIDDWGRLLDRQAVALVVNPATASPMKDTYILCVGDSITASGAWPSECMRRFCGISGEPMGLELHNIHFVGSREGQYGARYEGYGGWRFDSYNNRCHHASPSQYIYADHGKTDLDRHSTYTDRGSLWKLEEIEDGRIKVIGTKYLGPLPQSGTLHHVSGGEDHKDIIFTKVEEAAGNPFWDLPKGCVDFQSYAKRIGAPDINICVVILGWNAWNSSEQEIKEQACIFIENLHRDYPACQILLVGPHTTANQDGFGTNYGASPNWNYFEKLEFAFLLDGWYRELADAYAYVTYVNMAGQFDSEYNYPTIERKANMRVCTTEIIQANGLHPTNEGYNQIADIIFRQLNAILLNL